MIENKTCSARIRQRTHEERDKMVAEATYVGTAFVIVRSHATPIAVVYGESREEVGDKLFAKIRERGYSGFDVV